MAMEKYDRIGIGYNQTRRADPYLAQRLHELLAPKPGGLYLEIGAGTGNYTHALSEMGLQMIGVEPSDHMREKAQARDSDIDWRKGWAESIPAEDASVDGAVGFLTIHHWKDQAAGFHELYRVLKPGGRFVLFTATPQQIAGYWLQHYFPRMMADSTPGMPAWPELSGMLEGAGFENLGQEPYFIRDGHKDLFLYAGKRQPELYFDERVRSGISSFSAIAYQEEVDAGLAALRTDIDSGKWEAVAKQYENTDGDYLWVSAQRGA